jgi:hypothetical protein
MKSKIEGLRIELHEVSENYEQGSNLPATYYHSKNYLSDRKSMNGILEVKKGTNKKDKLLSVSRMKHSHSNSNDYDINEAWKNILITNLIPENKLLSGSDQDAIFQGALNKLVPNSSRKIKPTYVIKYCLVNKKEFLCFKSKESFLCLQQPQFKISLDSIAYANRIRLNEYKISGKTYYYMYIQIGEVKDDSSTRHPYIWSSEDDSSPENKRSKKNKFIHKFFFLNYFLRKNSYS